MAALLVAAALLAVSCSTTPPQIAQTFWQLNLVQNPHTHQHSEALSLFVHVTDSQGLSDLDSIYLISDSSELYWKLDQSNWQSRETNGELWVGSNMIRMPDGSAIPHGRYRVLLSNLAGERATSELFVSADRLDPKQITFPSLSLTATAVTISPQPAGALLWVYGGNGELLGTRPAGSRAIPLASLAPKASVSGLSLYAYAYDKGCGCGLLSGPYHPGGAGPAP